MSFLTPEVIGCGSSSDPSLGPTWDGAERRCCDAEAHGLQQLERSEPRADMGLSRAAVPWCRRSWAAAARAIRASGRHGQTSAADATAANRTEGRAAGANAARRYKRPRRARADESPQNGSHRQTVIDSARQFAHKMLIAMRVMVLTVVAYGVNCKRYTRIQ